MTEAVSTPGDLGGLPKSNPYVKAIKLTLEFQTGTEVMGVFFFFN